MEKINFQDLPITKTPINSSNLNLLQSNIESAIGEVKQPDLITNGEPVKCGYKIDGKDVYVKLVDCGYLNAGTYKIPHNISNIDKMYGYKGFFRNESNKTIFSLPRFSTSNVGVDADIDITNINITAGSAFNGTSFKAYIYIYFSYAN